MNRYRYTRKNGVSQEFEHPFLTVGTEVSVGLHLFTIAEVVGPGVYQTSRGSKVELLVGARPAPVKDAQAFKSDAGKPDFDLLMSGAPNALLGVVKVLSWAVAPKPMAPWPDGGKGYVPHSWQQVPEAKRRYRAALLRHQNAVARGELTDDESGLSHWYHIATNALFLAELESIQEVK